jgi:ABC-2 type transport system permease protein
MMIFPVFLQILILGYALTTEVRNTTLTIYDLSGSPQSRSLINSVKNNNLFTFTGFSVSYPEIKDKIDRGIVKIGLIIPETFVKDLHGSDGVDLQMLVDGQDANSANIANGYLNAIISQWGNAFFENKLKSQGIEISNLIPVRVNPVILFNPSLKSTWFMVPALVVLLITIVTSLLSGLSIVKEKEKGTLEQLLVTPVNQIHIVFGKTIPYLIFGFIELIIFFLFAILWFHIPFRGNFLLIGLFAAVYMVSSLGIGILTSTLARTPQQVLFLVWFILIFFILLSGFFMPVENMPDWVQKITNINPVKFFMFAIREIFLKGSGLADLTRELYALTAIGVVVFCAALLFFKRKTK